MGLVVSAYSMLWFVQCLSNKNNESPVSMSAVRKTNSLDKVFIQIVLFFYSGNDQLTVLCDTYK